jgi:hypothetical protein
MEHQKPVGIWDWGICVSGVLQVMVLDWIITPVGSIIAYIRCNMKRFSILFVLFLWMCASWSLLVIHYSCIYTIQVCTSEHAHILSTLVIRF